MYIEPNFSNRCADRISRELMCIIRGGENRQNLHIFNLWPVIYHTEKNSCANPTPETLSVEIYMSQHDYPKSKHFFFVAIDVSQRKTVPV